MRASVSVIIPCYKQAHFLHDSIESVLAQTVAADEILVIDDGSPDHPELVCRRYGHSVRCHHQENMGVGSARNTGIPLCHGSHIIFLDADDRLLPQAIERQSACFRESPHLGLVFRKYRQINHEGRVRDEDRPAIVTNDHYARLLQRNVIGCPASVMFRREAVEHVGGFDLNPCSAPAGDYDIYLQVARNHEINGVECFVAEYRRQRDSMSRNPHVMLKAVLAVLHRQWPHVQGNPRLERALRDGMAHARRVYGEEMYWIALKALRRKKFRIAANEIVQLSLAAPGALLASFGSHVAGRAKGFLAGSRDRSSPQLADDD